MYGPGLVNCTLIPGTPKTATVTVTSASPAVVSWTAHGLASGDPVVFRSSATMPTGITSGNVYYVMTAGLTANAFQISATSGGAAVNTSSTGTGTITGYAGIVFSLKTYAGTDPTAADPILGLYRSATATSGANVGRAWTGAISLSLPFGNGALQPFGPRGSATSNQMRVWFVLFDDAGTPRLGAINCWSMSSTASLLTRLCENTLASSTAITLGSSGVQGTIYTSVAVTNKPYKVVGFADWPTGNAPDTNLWIAPTLVQNFMAGVALPGDYLQEASGDLVSLDSTTTTVANTTNHTMTSSEGKQFLSAALTPAAVMNIIEITTELEVGSTAAGQSYLGFFNGSTCLRAGQTCANVFAPAKLSHKMFAGQVTALTINMRLGPNATNAGTATINGYGPDQYILPTNSFLQLRERQG